MLQKLAKEGVPASEGMVLGGSLCQRCSSVEAAVPIVPADVGVERS